MSLESIVFVALTIAFTVLQVAHAQKPKADGTVYNLLDRISWIAGGAVALAVGFWRPWFMTTWWKAAIFAPVLCTAFSSFFLSGVGSMLTTKTNDSRRIAAQLIVRIVGLLAVFFALRSCGA
jgi:hypothetical protein